MKTIRQRPYFVIAMIVFGIFSATNQLDLWAQSERPSKSDAKLNNTHTPLKLSSPNYSSVSSPSSVTRPVKLKYAPEEIIVEYDDQKVTRPIGRLFRQKSPLKEATVDKSAAFQQMHHQFVADIKPVFWGEADEERAAFLKDVRKGFKEKMKQWRDQYPDRAKSIPSNTPELEVGYFYQVKLKPGTKVEDALAAFRADRHIKSAQTNDFVEVTALGSGLPNDTYVDPDHNGTWSTNAWEQGTLEDLWGAKKIKAHEAWPTTQGAGIVVAVVDTGLDYNHPDIAANVWQNLGEDADHDGHTVELVGGRMDLDPGDLNNRDDDGNGKIDDLRGWDTTTCALWGDAACLQPKAEDNDPMDGYGHGTHVSGTIAAVGNNNLGIIGIAPQVKLMPVKALNDQGSATYLELKEAILYAVSKGAKVINNSWGCLFGCPSNPVIEEAVRIAYAAGTVTVFAGGNSSLDERGFSPQNMVNPKPVVVAASDPADNPTFFSNYGALVDVSAPGGDVRNDASAVFESFRNILSLKSMNTDEGFTKNGRLIVDGQYARQAGTSMSAPHACGVAALILANAAAQGRTLTNEDVRVIMRASADDVLTPGFDIYSGAGRLNVRRALMIDQPLIVKINFPVFNQPLSADQPQIFITGTAKGLNFTHYEVSYGRGRSPLIWTPITPAPVTSPVDNAALATWDISNLPTDEYWIRLTARARVGSENFEYHDLLRIIIEEPPRRITNNAAEQSFPALAGDTIVWQDNRNGNWDIYGFNLAAGVEEQITTNTANQKNPAISDEWVVWEDDRNGTSNQDIYGYNLTTGQEEQLTINTANQLNVAIDGETIVWEDWRRVGGSYIYLKDLGPGSFEQVISSSPTVAGKPAIDGDHIVWQGNEVTDFPRIYLYDRATHTEEQITDSHIGLEAHQYPDVSGDWVAWNDSRNSNPPTINWDVYGYNISAQTEQAIGIGAGHQYYPAIDGRRMVYYDSGDISAYDVILDRHYKITSNPAPQHRPDISGSKVAWQDLRDGNWEIYMTDIDHSPVLEFIPNQRVQAGDELRLIIQASDEENDPLTYSALGNPLSAGATFDPATREFVWTPTARQLGSYEVTFTVSDGNKSASRTITIAVMDETRDNHPPVLAAVGNQSVGENELLTVILSATDPDGDALTFRVEPLPTGAVFDSQTRTFTWQPGFNQVGIYPIRILVSDGEMDDAELITITVQNTNRLPVFSGLTNKTVVEGEMLEFNFSFSDPDNDAVTCSVTNLPTGAVFNQTSRTFQWRPEFDQAGLYPVIFTANDGQDITSKNIFIEVTQGYPAFPIIAAPFSQSNPFIYGDYVGWEDFHSNPRDIYIHNLRTQAGQRIVAEANQLNPVMWDHWLVWQDDRISGNWDIYLYDLNSGLEQRLTNTDSQTNPDIDNGVVVWQDNRNGNWDIYAYVIATGEERRITSDTYDQGNPEISGNKIVYQDTRNGNLDIYIYDLDSNTETPLVVRSDHQLNPDISGNKVVFTDIPFEQNHRINMYDLNTNQEITLDYGVLSQSDAHIAGDRIVWVEGGNQVGAPIYYIVYYDLLSKQRHILAYGPGTVSNPTVSEQMACWEQTNNRWPNIFCANFNQANNLRPFISVPGPQTVRERELLKFRISGADHDGDVLFFRAMNLPPGAIFDPSTRTFTWRPAIGQTGNYVATFTVTDLRGLSASGIVPVTVQRAQPTRKNPIPFLGEQMFNMEL